MSKPSPKISSQTNEKSHLLKPSNKITLTPEEKESNKKEQIDKYKNMIPELENAIGNVDIKNLNPEKQKQFETLKSDIAEFKKAIHSENVDMKDIQTKSDQLRQKFKSMGSGKSNDSVGKGDAGVESKVAGNTQTQPVSASVSASASAPPGAGTDNDTIKVEFQALYDNAYTEIKQCFCQGMANLFYEAFVPSTEHVYEALNKALYVDVVDKNSGGIASQLNPDYEILVGDQIEKIMKFIMTNPDPQIKIDIRKNLSGGCNISQEHHQASITRGKPTAIVGGSSTYKHQTKHPKIYTQKKPHKKSM